MSKACGVLVNVTLGVYVQEKLVEGKHTTCPLDHFFIVVLWHTVNMQQGVQHKLLVHSLEKPLE